MGGEKRTGGKERGREGGEEKAMGAYRDEATPNQNPKYSTAPRY